MKKIVIISGPSASGKSTYVKHLKDICNVPIFEKDKIKIELVKAFSGDVKTIEASKCFGKICYNILWYIVDAMMSTKLDFVIESNFILESRGIINQLLKKYNYNGILIKFDASDEILYERFIARDKGGIRGKELGIGLYKDFKVFSETVQAQREFELDIEKVYINTNESDEYSLKQIDEKVEHFLKLN